MIADTPATNIIKDIVLLVMLMMFSTLTNASVTMIGTRIIYPAESSSVNVEFANKDVVPYAVQVWIDSSDEESTPATAKAPFIATPALFRIMPGSGQVLRLTYTGVKNLPKDRESVFYFNFLQIPPANMDKDSEKKSNSVLVMLKNRLKIFYRPHSIAKKTRNNKDDILISTSQVGDKMIVNINNTSPFFVSLINVNIKSGNKKYSRNASMLEPFSQAEIEFESLPSMKDFSVDLTSINDQGAYVNHVYEITGR